jgi:ribosomal-protein-alanine N-acetyltransferase
MKSPKSALTIRPYEDSDESAVLALFDQLSPAFFAPPERVDLAYYLSNEREWYYVLIQDDTLIAAGGINFNDNQKTGIISWDLVCPSFHGIGIGSALLQHRIHILQALPSIQKIRVRTSQFTFPFYEKFGFKTLEIRYNYWAKNYHLYDMIRAK